jgi:pimeloyl-ACP methyl ester carboxylesterase
VRILKWNVIGLASVLILAIASLWIGAASSLDRDYSHTAATEALPLFAGTSSAGLVRIPANGMEFRARVGGFRHPDPKGDLLLLHGFPETSIMYEPLIQAASQAGYRVVAPDQRGYSPGARPAGRAAYAGNLLMADALAIADAVGFARFHLVGHDWGAGIGWQLAIDSADRLKSYTALSIPHIASFGAAIADDPEQQDRSSYMAFFWLPWLPEQTFAVNDLAALRALYVDHPEPEQEEYLAVFSEPGAMTGALNWYRASADGGGIGASGNVTTPILFIWGNQDPAVGRTAVEGQGRYIDGPLEEIEVDTGHWLMATAPADVVPAVLAHVARFNAP